MRSRRLYAVFIVLGAIAVLAALLVSVWRPGRHAPENPLSATAKTPLGMNALYLLLRNNGVKADFYGLPLDVLPPDITLIVGDDFVGSITYDWIGSDELWKLAEERGNTIVYLPPMGSKDFSERTTADETEDAENPQGQALTTAQSAEEKAELSPEVARYEIPWEIDAAGYIHIRTSGLPEKYFGGVTELQAGGFHPLQDVIPLSEDEKALATAQEVYFFKDTDRPFLFAGRSGRGTWVAANVSELFTNRDIGRADNAVFAFNLLSNHEEGGLAFYEAIHGYRQLAAGTTALLFQTRTGQVVLLALLGIIILLLPRMFPLGHDIERPVIEFPSTLERIRAQAELWRQAGHLKSAQRLSIESVLGIDAGGDPEELVELLRQVGYAEPRASQLAAELTGQRETRRMSGEAIRAYDRIMRRFGLIRRFA